jgi:succinate-semialdehyde dehydrogenase / glutarate-semialdehyde dehydrogenase
MDRRFGRHPGHQSRGRQVIGHVPKLGAAETRKAIEAAEKAQKHWAKKTAKERTAILRKWFDLMIENQEDLARIMTA